jgi:phage terminase large subunit-like protein
MTMIVSTRPPSTYRDLIDRVYCPIDPEGRYSELLTQPDLSSVPPEKALRFLELLKQKKMWAQHTQLATWFRDPSDYPTFRELPLGRQHYPKHMAFFEAGARFDERAMFGGNRTGKTHCGVFEDVLHLTGLYPEWWKGRRFNHPIDMWVATDTAKNTRDILQEKFCGKPGAPDALGTGLIPGDLFARQPTIKHGLADAIETVFVRHVSGGVSTCMFKSYDQGREAFQGTKQHLIHLDEEPKIEIYSECLMRLMSTVPGEANGLLVLTETPLLGISELMTMFMPELSPEPDAAPKHDGTDDEIVIEE